MLTMDAHPGPVHALAFRPDGLLVSAGAGGVRVWDPPTVALTLHAGSEPVWCLAVAPDGKHVACGGTAIGGGQVEVSRFDQPGRASAVSNPRPVSAVAFLSPTRLAYALGEKAGTATAACTLFFWDFQPKPGTLVLQAARKSTFDTVHGIRALASDPPRNRLAWVTDTKYLMLQDITRPAVKPVVLKKDARAVAISPDGRKLAVTSDWDVLLYEADQWPTAPTTLGRHQGSVTALAFTPDSRHLYSGAVDQTVKLWDVDRGSERATFAWPVGRVTALAVAPDGLRAAVAGSDGKVAVWDVD
jgi:WD40 repeat protein